MSCLSCEATFEDMNSLRLHCLLQNHLHFLYTCGSCNAAFISLEALKSHMALHGLVILTEPAGEITITMQGQATSTKSSDEVFLPAADTVPVPGPRSSIQRAFKCTYCELTFETKTGRKSHKEATHIIYCQHCGRAFYNANNLDKHVQRDHQVATDPSAVQKTFKCPLCELVFDTKAQRRSHKKATHKIKCQHCKKGFYNQGVLDNHIQRVHQVVVNPSSEIQFPSSSTELRGGRNIKCRYCDQVFANKGPELKSHRNTHRIWSCSSCNARFFTEDKLNKHERKVHPHIIHDLEQPETMSSMIQEAVI